LVPENTVQYICTVYTLKEVQGYVLFFLDYAWGEISAIIVCKFPGRGEWRRAAVMPSLPIAQHRRISINYEVLEMKPVDDC
jgi:hypothetical protein